MIAHMAMRTTIGVPTDPLAMLLALVHKVPRVVRASFGLERTRTRRKKKTRVSRKLSPLTHDGHHLALRINEQSSDGPSCMWLATRIRPNNLIAASAKQLGGQLLTIVTVVFHFEFGTIATVATHHPTSQGQWTLAVRRRWQCSRAADDNLRTSRHRARDISTWKRRCWLIQPWVAATGFVMNTTQ